MEKMTSKQPLYINAQDYNFGIGQTYAPLPLRFSWEPEFITYPSIPRIARDILITEKIDGTNAQIYITDSGDMHVGSRSRWITPGKATDNYGFAAWCEDNRDDILGLGPGRHYGEWFGQGIQRGYDLDEKRFYLFRGGSGRPLPKCVGVVPFLYEGPWADEATTSTMQALKEGGSVAAPGYMLPEGIVIFHKASRQMYKKTFEYDEAGKSNGSKK